MYTDRPRRRFATDQVLGTILRQAGIDKQGAILITGPAGLATLLWFCRHNYQRVGYARTGRAPAEDSDLLLVPQTCGAHDLERILEEGPHVRQGGVLIVQTPELDASAAVDPIHRLPRRFGFRIERCLHGRHREMHVARRIGRP